MRILCLAPKSPLPDNSGSRRRILRLTEAASQDHDTLLVVATRRLSSDDAAALASTTSVQAEVVELPLASPGIAARGRWLAGRGDPLSWQRIDVVHASAAIGATISRFRPDAVWCTSATMAGVLLRDLQVPLVVDVAHVEGSTIDSQLRRAVRSRSHLKPSLVLGADRAARRAAERRGFSMASLLTPCSDVEAAGARRVLDRPMAVIPNGVDLPDALGWTASSRQLLFVSNFGYAPNREAFRLLVDDVLPRLRRVEPNSTVVAAGPGLASDDPLAQRPGVDARGFVDDLAPLYQAAGLVIAPVMSGSGTNIKVIEAFAYGVPVVTTPMGIEGLDVRADVHVSVGATADTLAARATELFAEPAMADRQRRAARAVVERDLGWDRIGAAFVAALRRISEA